MPDNVNLDNGSENKPKTFKDFWLQILIALLITSGLSAAAGGWLKEFIQDYTHHYNCRINLQSSSKIDLSNIAVIINGDHNTNLNKPTKSNGSVIFELRKGVYTCRFLYANAPVTRDIDIPKDSSITIDVAEKIFNPKTGKPMNSSLAQPSKFNNRPLVKVSTVNAVVPISETSVSSQATHATAMPSFVTAPPKQLTPDEIMQSLQLHVSIDSNDSFRNHGKQFAYRYYLIGEKALLDRITEVFYQRNDSTFPEFNSHEFNVSDDRSKNFEYIGYQYGNIFTTYVQIMIDGKEKSQVYLKQITYDR